ncbi:MAG: sulfotransferase family protein [Henriciella sp.]
MNSSRHGRAIIILGMHRSGTSALAGTLRAHGVYFGEVLDQGIQYNPKGLQEAPSILYMQEDLMAKNGGAWHSPPDEIKWQPLHKAVRDLFIESRSSQPLWAFKDPRTLLTLEGWYEVLPNLAGAGIFRHPAEVAMSIHTRNGFALEKCLEIWCAYNQRLLDFHHAHKIPVIEFVGDQATMERSFKSMIDALGLGDNAPEQTFFEAGMKHQDRPDMALTPRAIELYQALQAAAL